MENKGYNKSSIVLYKAEDNSIQIEVKLEKDSVWLTQEQMAQLFQRDKSVITRHIRNIYAEGKLMPESTSAKFAFVPDTRERSYEITAYNLDVIISVGYRVKSLRGTQFRIWANKILKDYLIKGYAINQNIQLQHYQELKEVVALLSRTLSLQEKPMQDEYAGLFNVISDYVYALDTLDSYDYQQLTIDKTTQVPYGQRY